MKHLATLLFDGRISPICVERMRSICRRIVIRLPVGLKFKIKQLMLGGAVGNTLEALAPILHESSFPLEKLVADYFFHDADVTNPIVAKARELKIRISSQEVPYFMHILSNQRVHFITWLTEEILEEAIGNWIRLERPIGTERRIEFIHAPRFEMEQLLMKLNGVPVDDENAIIPMSNAIQLNVSYGPFPEFAPHSKWAVRFFTEAIEH